MPDTGNWIPEIGKMINPYLNIPPTKLRRELEKVRGKKRKLIMEALSDWRRTNTGPFRRGSLLQDMDRESLNRTLWYENENGDIYLPDYENPADMTTPEGFVYQASRFPNNLHESYLMTTKKSDVDNCKHPKQYVHQTGGWIDGVEGRECDLCHGTQMRNVGEPWPDVWDSGGSREVMIGDRGWREDLVLALVNKDGMSLTEAIIFCATCCERCMNVAAYETGLDWGYAEGSEEYENCGTSCEFCDKDMKKNIVNKKMAIVKMGKKVIVRELLAVARELTNYKLSNIDI